MMSDEALSYQLARLYKALPDCTFRIRIPLFSGPTDRTITYEIVRCDGIFGPLKRWARMGKVIGSTMGLYQRHDEALESAIDDAIEHHINELGVRAALDWRRKWPNACKVCHGWGGGTFYETHGLPGPAERITDACDSLAETMCHRCGEHGLTEDSDGPCSFCGWNYNDGEPAL